MTTRAAPTSSALETGLYTFPEAARILHTPSAMIRRWAKGYTFREQGRPRAAAPVLQSQSSPQVSLLTFRDLIELLFVSLFRKQGLSLQSIRSAAEAAAREFGRDYPFTIRRFDTDGKRIFATLAEQDQVLREELRRGQFVFTSITTPLFKKLDYDDVELARRYWPWGKRGGIVLDPAIDLGAPLVARHGIPTHDLHTAWEANDCDARQVAFWYEIPIEDVQLALEYEQSLRSLAA